MQVRGWHGVEEAEAGDDEGLDDAAECQGGVFGHDADDTEDYLDYGEEEEG